MTVVGAVLMLVGAALMLTAAIGVYRFPDVLTRLHAATKAASVGIVLILLGAGAALGAHPFVFMLLVAAFHIMTAPIAAHALGRTTRTARESRSADAASIPQSARIIGLATVWVVLWGSVTAANVAGGLAVGSAVALLTRRRADQRTRIRPLAALRLAGVFGVMLVRSTISVAVASLGPRRLVEPVVSRIPLSACSTPALIATANAVSLTPGTLTLEIDANDPALVVHFIRSDDRAVEAIATLHTLAAAALPQGARLEEAPNDPRR